MDLWLLIGNGARAMTNRIREFRKALGWNQSELADRTGLDVGTISKYETGSLGRRAPLKTTQTIAAALGKTVAEVFPDAPETGQEFESADVVRTKPNASFPPRYQKFPDATIPLLGQGVTGANGKFVLNGQEVGRVFCPPELEGVEGAYAAKVYGTSMEPKFEAGETIWMHPWTPVRAGDYVLAQILVEDGEPPESYIKRFVSQSSKVLRLYQFNPEDGEPHELEFPADQVFSVHKIVFQALV